MKSKLTLGYVVYWLAEPWYTQYVESIHFKVQKDNSTIGAYRFLAPRFDGSLTSISVFRLRALCHFRIKPSNVPETTYTCVDVFFAFFVIWVIFCNFGFDSTRHNAQSFLWVHSSPQWRRCIRIWGIRCIHVTACKTFTQILI